MIKLEIFRFPFTGKFNGVSVQLLTNKLDDVMLLTFN